MRCRWWISIYINAVHISKNLNMGRFFNRVFNDTFRHFLPLHYYISFSIPVRECLEGAEFAVEEPFLPGLLAGPGLRLLQGVAQTHVLLQRLLLLLFFKEETSHEALYLSPQLQNDACATIPFGGGLLSLVLMLVYSSATPSAIKYSWSRIRITSPGLCMIRPLAAEVCNLESLASRPFST